jgi:hypothetical protein
MSCRHYCNLRSWPQPVIACLGEDGVPAHAPHGTVQVEGVVGPQQVPDAVVDTEGEETAADTDQRAPEELPRAAAAPL